MQILSKFLGQSGGVPAAGLDLNDLGLCWVELRQDKVRGLVLERCLFEPLAPGCVVQGEILEFSDVEAALARLLGISDAALNARAIPPMAVAVPASLVTTHGVNRPAKLTEAVWAEALQVDTAARLQRKPDEVCLDFVTQPADAADHDARQAKKTEVMVAAVPKEAVEDRIALVEGAGLPWRVDVVAMASQAAVLAARRAVARTGRTYAMVALVQLEAGALQLDILQHAKVLHSEGFVLDTVPAGAPEPLRALPPGLLQALESTYGSAGAGRPVQVWLAGPANMAAAWAGALQACSGLPCALVNAFEGMAPGDALDKRHRADSAQALVACGLALMALGDAGAAQPAAHQPFFNFFPHREAAMVQRRKSFVAQLGAVALFVLLGSAVLRVVLSHQLQTQQDAQAEVQQELAGLDAKLKHLAGAAAEMQRLQLQESVLIEFSQARQLAPLMWRDISALLPDGLHLTSLGQDEQGAAVLSGQARSAAEVFDLIERLSGGSQHVRQPELVDLSGMADAGVAAQATPLEHVVFTLRSRPP